MRNDTFSGYHPLINFVYFLIVIGMAMFYMHPVLLVLSLAGSVAYSVYLKGKKTVKIFFLGMVPACLLMMIINPLFSIFEFSVFGYTCSDTLPTWSVTDAEIFLSK